MRHLLMLMMIFSTAFVHAQNVPVKHPRVAEVEEKLHDEAARYFTRRFPNEAFLIKVEVNPLRRDMVTAQGLESLPYFDYQSEESVDEWDDPETPIAFLRHRVTKVIIEVDVPEKFEEIRLAEIKDEITAYLKLLPYRDEVKVIRKFKVQTGPLFPPHYYSVFFGAFLLVAVLGLMIRWSMSKQKVAQSGGMPAPQVASAPSSAGSSDSKRVQNSSQNVTTMHDPLKAVAIIQVKIDQIQKSGSFPTLNDILSLHQFGESNPVQLGALVYEMPSDWVQKIFSLGIGEKWLEAFTRPGPVDYDCLVLLDRMSKDRRYAGSSREAEDLLIQVWRLGDKCIQFVKKIPVEHAFHLLDMLPKSFSLDVAKKAFPGTWGRVLENQKSKIVLSSDLHRTYLQQALELVPYYEWSLLESYRKDHQLLSYLDLISIDDEKDVYQTLSENSFIPRVRPPFFMVFEQPEVEWKNFVHAYPLAQLALAVFNSSRGYSKKISDTLEEKQRIVFSQHLRNLDSDFDKLQQIDLRRQMARAVAVKLETKANSEVQSGNEIDGTHAQSA